MNEGEFSVANTGFRALVKRKNLDKNKNFVLGNNSLGAFFEDAGYAAVPSNKNKKPGMDNMIDAENNKNINQK